MPSADTPETYLKQAYLAELSGEVMMNCLAERFPERKSALQLLAGIEQKTAASLAASQAFTVTEAEQACLLYTSPSPRDATLSRMPSSA